MAGLSVEDEAGKLAEVEEGRTRVSNQCQKEWLKYLTSLLILMFSVLNGGSPKRYVHISEPGNVNLFGEFIKTSR